jgi:isopenicillin N synthase-like dioxygenase
MSRRLPLPRSFVSCVIALASFTAVLFTAGPRFGFFQLRHRIPDHVAERAMNEARLFVARPVDEKQRIGYTAAVRQ